MQNGLAFCQKLVKLLPGDPAKIKTICGETKIPLPMIELTIRQTPSQTVMTFFSLTSSLLSDDMAIPSLRDRPQMMSKKLNIFLDPLVSYPFSRFIKIANALASKIILPHEGIRYFLRDHLQSMNFMKTFYFRNKYLKFKKSSNICNFRKKYLILNDLA